MCTSALRRAAARAWARRATAREAPPTRKRWELCGQAKTPTPPGWDRCSPCANRPLPGYAAVELSAGLPATEAQRRVRGRAGERDRYGVARGRTVQLLASAGDDGTVRV